MSELRNAAARGADSLGRSMKAEYAKTQQRARSDGNSQQKSVTAFAEDEVAERARTSAVAAGQTARLVGRTAVQNTPQSADELKTQAKQPKHNLTKQGQPQPKGKLRLRRRKRLSRQVSRPVLPSDRTARRPVRRRAVQVIRSVCRRPAQSRRTGKSRRGRPLLPTGLPQKAFPPSDRQVRRREEA